MAAGAVPELPVVAAQPPNSQVPATFEQQQMQHMSAVMAMAAAAGMAGAGAVPGIAPGGGQMPLFGAGCTDPAAAAAAAAASAYTQIFTKYLQQIYAFSADPSVAAAAAAMSGSVPGAGPAPLPAIAPSMPTTMPQASLSMSPAMLPPAPAAMPAAQVPQAPPAPPTQPPPPPYVVTPPQLPLVDAVISVSVEGMAYNYQLTDDDLFKVFTRYGLVRHIRVEDGGTIAHIAFEQAVHAQAAVNDLNGKVLNGLDGKLRIDWVSVGGNSCVPVGASAPVAPVAPMAPAAPSPPYPAMPLLPEFANWGYNGSSVAWPAAPAQAATMFPSPSAPPQDMASTFAYSNLSSLAAARAPPVAAAAPVAATGVVAPPPPPPAPPAAAAALTAPSHPGVPNAADISGNSSTNSDPGVVAPGDTKPPPHVKGVRKYTCRFLIGIENDKDFQVVRRIIGAKGSNMKQIFKQTEAKLRLRGKGSGYFEGAGHKESAEPLQLCVSCTCEEGYKLAVASAEALIEQIYEEYRVFCREKGEPEPDLRAMAQVVSGREREPQRLGDVVTALGLNSPGWGATAAACEAEASSGSGGAAGADDSDDDDVVVGAPKKEGGGRRRGRRTRAGRSRGDAGKASVDRSEPPPRAPPVAEIERLIDQRNEARRQCNFAEADRIRGDLHERGVALMDEPGARGKGMEVTTWRYWRE